MRSIFRSWIAGWACVARVRLTLPVVHASWTPEVDIFDTRVSWTSLWLDHCNPEPSQALPELPWLTAEGRCQSQLLSQVSVKVFEVFVEDVKLVSWNTVLSEHCFYLGDKARYVIAISWLCASA